MTFPASDALEQRLQAMLAATMMEQQAGVVAKLSELADGLASLTRRVKSSDMVIKNLWNLANGSP